MGGVQEDSHVHGNFGPVSWLFLDHNVENKILAHVQAAVEDIKYSVSDKSQVLFGHKLNSKSRTEGTEGQTIDVSRTKKSGRA